jgi:signal peptidase I
MTAEQKDPHIESVPDASEAEISAGTEVSLQSTDAGESTDVAKDSRAADAAAGANSTDAAEVADTDEPADTGSETDGPRRGFFREYGRIFVYALFIALFLKIFFVEAFGIPTPSMQNTLMVGDFLFVNKFVYGLRTPRAIPLTGIRIPHLKIFPGYASPKRGDVIVFEYPGDHATVEQPQVMNYVKRCIGLPGDTVELAGKRLFVNGVRQELPTGAVTASRVLGRGDFNIAIYPKGASFNNDWWGPMVVPYEDMEVELTLENIDGWRLFIEREGHTVRFTAEGDIQVDGNDANSYIVENDYYFMLGDSRDNSEDSRYWGFVPEKNLIGEAMVIYWSWDSRIPFTTPFALIGSIRWDRIFSIVH